MIVVIRSYWASGRRMTDLKLQKQRDWEWTSKRITSTQSSTRSCSTTTLSCWNCRSESRWKHTLIFDRSACQGWEKMWREFKIFKKIQFFQKISIFDRSACQGWEKMSREIQNFQKFSKFSKNFNIWPICLPRLGEDVKGTAAIVVGWGSIGTEGSSKTTNVLRQVGDCIFNICHLGFAIKQKK